MHYSQHNVKAIVLALLLLCNTAFGSADPMILSHNALRKEVHSMITALGSLIDRTETKDGDSAVPKWTVDTLHTLWKKHELHASDHCMSEETMYKPLLGDNWPDAIDRTHIELSSMQKQVKKAVDKLSKDRFSLKAVHDSLLKYKETMLNHLELEEKTVLPLLQANFNPEEVSQMQRKMLEEGNENAMGALIYAMSSDGSRFRNEFMKPRNIPSFVWFVTFKRQLSHYKDTVVAKVEAIESGEQPTMKRTGWL